MRKAADLRVATKPVPGLKVATINVSWEVENFQARCPHEHKNLRDARHDRKSSWRRAYEAWEASANTSASQPRTGRPNMLGPAYIKIIYDVFVSNPDVVLIQEFQTYTMPNGKTSVQYLLEAVGNKYTLCAKKETTMQRFSPQISSLVLVRSDKVADDPNDISAYFIKQIEQFNDDGRAFAAAIVNLVDSNARTKSNYLIISSHSKHRQAWDETNTKETLKRIQDVFVANRVEPPPFLIWGGDFNKQVSIGTSCKWCGRKVTKIPGQEMAVTHKNHKPAKNRPDCIMATCSYEQNPTDQDAKWTASDHAILSMTLRLPFSDAATP